MPTLNINQERFEKMVGKKLPLDKLKDRISYLGTDLESIENNEIVVEIFPDRPDMLSVPGFARAFSAFIGVKTGLRKYEVKKSNEKVIIESSLKDVRPYTACAIVRNLKFDDEKIKEVVQVQEKLHVTYGRNRRKIAIGIYPYEKIKTPIRFKALKPEEIRFQPLEFPNVINGRQILSQHPTGREYAHLLEGQEKYPVFLDANNKVLSMPPIINSHETGKITEQTRDVFVECSGFDFNALSACLNIIVTALAEMGGTIYSMELNYPDKKRVTPNLEPREMSLDIKYLNKRLGLELKEAEAIKLLARMGYGNKGKKILVPAYRADIMHEVDIVEDVAIAYGFENFKPEIPQVATIAEENPVEMLRNKIANYLIGFGLIETNSYNLTNNEELGKKMLMEEDAVELANSLSAEYNVLRTWMVPSMLKILSMNKHNEYPQNIFEIGNIFIKDEKTETNVAEYLSLGVALCHAKADYTEAKQIMDALFRALNLEYSIAEAEHSSFIQGRIGTIKAKGKKIGFIGEVHPEVLTNFQIGMPTAAFELNISELLEVLK